MLLKFPVLAYNFANYESPLAGAVMLRMVFSIYYLRPFLINDSIEKIHPGRTHCATFMKNMAVLWTNVTSVRELHIQIPLIITCLLRNYIT